MSSRARRLVAGADGRAVRLSVRRAGADAAGVAAAGAARPRRRGAGAGAPARRAADRADACAPSSARLAALEREAFAKGYAQGERAGVEAGGKRAEAMLRRARADARGARRRCAQT